MEAFTRQQFGLAGNVVDEADDVADLLGVLGELADDAAGAVGIGHGPAGDGGGIVHLLADLGDGGAELFRRGGDRLDIARGVLRGRGDDAGLAAVSLADW